MRAEEIELSTFTTNTDRKKNTPGIISTQLAAGAFF